MEFCNECGTMMKADDALWHCTRCDNTHPRDDATEYVITEAQEGDGVIETTDDAEAKGLPTTEADCPECDNSRAYWYLQQTRAADESETRFFICTECDHQWRDYD